MTDQFYNGGVEDAAKWLEVRADKIEKDAPFTPNEGAAIFMAQSYREEAQAIRRLKAGPDD